MENEGNQGPATPGTAVRCEVCNRDLAAEPHDAFDAQCSRDGVWRLKAENASLLESLRACRDWFAEEAEDGRGDAWKMRDLCRAALHDEERRCKHGYLASADESAAKCAAARDKEQSALAEIAAGWPAVHAGELHPEDVVVSAASAPEAPTESVSSACAALHDEERSAPPQEGEDGK